MLKKLSFKGGVHPNDNKKQTAGKKIEIMEDLIAIQGKSVAELREIAKSMGMKNISKCKKEELIVQILH